jgi:hypothetical protein
MLPELALNADQFDLVKAGVTIQSGGGGHMFAAGYFIALTADQPFSDY